MRLKGETAGDYFDRAIWPWVLGSVLFAQAVYFTWNHYDPGQIAKRAQAEATLQAEHDARDAIKWATDRKRERLFLRDFCRGNIMDGRLFAHECVDIVQGTGADIGWYDVAPLTEKELAWAGPAYARYKSELMAAIK